MIGKRIDASNDPYFNPGEYGRLSNGKWCACTPNGHVAGLANHEVVEHEDGTITASPSILVTNASGDEQLWHGYLERGIWREV